MPALNKALGAVKVLKQKQITELKTFNNVSEGVKILHTCAWHTCARHTCARHTREILSLIDILG
eukprot:1354217-Amorphochlora_amoeboformis.AAC.1